MVVIILIFRSKVVRVLSCSRMSHCRLRLIMNIGEYSVIQPLGHGSFGAVYLVQSHSKLYALKLETPHSGQSSRLGTEHYLLRLLQPSEHFPVVYKSGKAGSSSYLVMELLGQSLEALLAEGKGKIPFGTWLRSWRWGLGALEALHELGYVHRDVKPGNFATDIKGERVVLFDLGLGKAYMNEKTGEHFPDSDYATFTGTVLFSSLNVLKGISHTPRDDLESFFLSLIYLSNSGKLPWSRHMRDHNKARKLFSTLQVASQVSVEDLCRGLPVGVEESVRYVRGLSYGEKPDYEYLKGIAGRCVEVRVERQMRGEEGDTGKKHKDKHREQSSPPKAIRMSSAQNLSLSPVIISPEPTEVINWTNIRLSPRLRPLRSSSLLLS